MKELKVELGQRSYPILIGKGLLGDPELFVNIIHSSQVMVVSNTTIASLYLPQLLDTLADFSPLSYVIADGESHKNLTVMNEIVTQLLENKFSRNCTLIALGGGVVGDITGFAAACYQRGANYIQIPTTLLAQVDSSVGGKTAVNHEIGKNMIGAFHQPIAVYSDSDVLDTLPDRELSAGLAEVIKYGLIRDPVFFTWLENNIESLRDRDDECLQYAIERSCQNKAEVVADDEREQGQRALLNFGHTFAHAVETGLNYKDWLHGEAVGLGMLMAADLSCRSGWITETDLARIRDLLIKAGLPIKLPEQFEISNMRELMSVDKKAKDGQLFLVVLKSIGDAVVTNEFDENLLQLTVEQFSSVKGKN
ncbi:MAG: 3-dehydroquinate synthase [Gammaproteobacteria bacterium]|jgi:3-dehydroquinate synthase|nr:3-dehydroquinate synthase [Gammaproteobacteria bacterium]